MDKNVLFKIGYGLYVLTANEQGKDNGCIINSVMQVTSEPCQIAVTVNKQNYTCGMIQSTKKFNISILSEDSSIEQYKRFGFQSGRNINKFDDYFMMKRSPNGVLYIVDGTNGYISAYVKQELDLGTHVMFIGQIVDAEELSDKPTATYDYYQKQIKQNVNPQIKKSGWRCKICNYVYENENLPDGYICPICKHGVEDFERV